MPWTLRLIFLQSIAILRARKTPPASTLSVGLITTPWNLRRQKTDFATGSACVFSGKRKQQSIRKQLQTTEQARQVAQDRRKQTREQLIGMEAQRLGVHALQNKDAAQQMLK